MKLVLTFGLIIIGLGPLMGQLQLISFGGDTHYSNAFQLSFSMGEVAVETYETSTGLLTEGLHQRATRTSTSIREITPLSVKLFPNPTSQDLYVQVDGLTDGPIMWTYTITDMKGRVVASERLHGGLSDVQRLSVGHIPPGMYIIQIVSAEDNNQIISRFIKQ